MIFAQTMTAGGDFHTFVPLPEAIAREFVAPALTIGTAVSERSAAMHGEPSVETISVDDSHVLLAWNGSLFPGFAYTNRRAARWSPWPRAPAPSIKSR